MLQVELVELESLNQTEDRNLKIKTEPVSDGDDEFVNKPTRNRRKSTNKPVRSSPRTKNNPKMYFPESDDED